MEIHSLTVEDEVAIKQLKCTFAKSPYLKYPKELIG